MHQNILQKKKNLNIIKTEESINFCKISNNEKKKFQNQKKIKFLLRNMILTKKLMNLIEIYKNFFIKMINLQKMIIMISLILLKNLRLI